jgi:diaminopimelate decarboxylase
LNITPTPAELLAARPALSMHARDGLLLEAVSLGVIAAEVGTPVWVYGAGTLRARTRALAAALAPVGAGIHYAVKANDHLAVLAVLAAEGVGADVVSAGELARAQAAGIAAGRIVFSGVGKSRAELAAALAAGICQINVESAAELEMVAAVARGENRVAAIAIRVNPAVDAGTHDKIATGRAGDKFGIAIADVPALYRRAADDPALLPVGIALHIGSQIATMAPFRAAYGSAGSLVGGLRAAGLAVSRVDCGGGLGIGYRDEAAASPAAFAGVIAATLGRLGVALIVEPGRWLVGPAGVLLASVVLVKHGAAHRFVVLDAGMNDLVRPALYEAWHGIVPLSPLLLHAALTPADVVGPVCESSDFFARGRLLPELAAEDTVAILDAGAYGAVMSSTYNARPLAAQVLVDGAAWEMIRPRPPLAALWREESIPAWLLAR